MRELTGMSSCSRQEVPAKQGVCAMHANHSSSKAADMLFVLQKSANRHQEALDG
jgi:hypothetical protein